MKKIISLFQRNYHGDRLVRDEVTPGAEWVIAGEGVATRKFDGTCCLIKDGKLFKRYDAKNGKLPPPDFIPAQEPDKMTGHYPGWVPVHLDSKENHWHLEAFNASFPLSDGTYELCGPRINGNPDNVTTHQLIAHGKELVRDVPRSFDALKQWFETQNIEGIVWHRENGDMVKIKKRDFGLKR